MPGSLARAKASRPRSSSRKNRRTRGLARGNPQQNAQAHQGSRPGRRRGVEVDGTPNWSHDGIICTGESYKNVVKLTFAKGASLRDPARLFNSRLDGNARRAIDIHEDFSAKSVRILQSRVGHRCSNPECRRPLMPRFGKRGAARLGFDAVADLAPFTTPIHVSAQGMLTWKLVPPPTVLSTQMRPLWASTIPLQIASPSPALARDA